MPPPPESNPVAALPLIVLLITAVPASAARLFVPDTGRARDTATVQVDRTLARYLATHRRRIVLDDVPLATLRDHKALAEMQVLAKGNRLSITPVTEAQWRFITEHLV